MKHSRSIPAAAAVIMAMVIGMPITALGAPTYWAYSYQGIDVIGDSAASVKSLAHNLHRLDTAITVAMSADSTQSRPLTRVYSLPDAMFTRVRGGQKDGSCSLFTSNPFSNTILIDKSISGDNTLWGAYYGFTGSVLVSAYSFRYPRWFIYGISEVFAASKMNDASVTIGSFNPGRVQTLYRKTLVPVKTFLEIHGNDPQLQSREFADLYEAESWFLVHLIVIEGKYRSNFDHYFRMLDRGQSESKAFAGSFDISYEDLDKGLQDALRRGKIQTLKVALADEKDALAATRLSDAEAAGRLAALAARMSPQPDDALQMANDAIRLDPKNQDALFALAHAQIRRTDYSEAFQASDGLCAQDSLTRAAMAECGQLFSSLSTAVSEKKAVVGVEAPLLAERSRQYYEKAIAMDPDDLEPWDGLANLLAQMRNSDYTHAFLPRAHQALSAHPRNGEFARALAGLNASTGDYVSALNYATMWQTAALNEGNRDAAAAYISRLKAEMERSSLRSAAKSP
jgi:tetratricopeptide (TPR) repeat protein